MKADIAMHGKMTASQILAYAGIKSESMAKYEEKRDPNLYSTS